MSIVIFLIVLAVLILAHEFGHFIVAKRSGVRVCEFGLGFPPRLFGIKRGETLYSLNAIPFGGFVRIFGENPEDVAGAGAAGEDVSRAFTAKPKLVQAAILLAGVVFNILLAWVLISAGFASGLPMPVGSAPAGAVVRNAEVTITGIEQGSPAAEAGLIPGDKIVSLESGGDVLADPSVTAVQAFIAEHGGSEVVIGRKKGSGVSYISVVPVEGIVEGKPAVGISMDAIGFVQLPPHRALWEGAVMTVGLTGAIVSGFAGLIGDAFAGEAALSNLAGPIGLVGLVGDAVDFGFVYLLGFTALISINLAILNLLPIPALDGGRLFFLLVEIFKGSPINQKVVHTAHVIGFSLLILLMLVVSYNDIMRYF